jgi:hypothetical protein
MASVQIVLIVFQQFEIETDFEDRIKSSFLCQKKCCYVADTDRDRINPAMLIVINESFNHNLQKELQEQHRYGHTRSWSIESKTSMMALILKLDLWNCVTFFFMDTPTVSMSESIL